MNEFRQSQSSNGVNRRPSSVPSLLWGAVGACMLSVWILSSLGATVTQWVGATGIPDFFWHLVLYAGLCLLASAAFRSTWPTQETWVLSVQGAVMALGYSILDEIHQNFIPGRGTEAQDIAGNLAGVVLAVALVILWQTLMTRHR